MQKYQAEKSAAIAELNILLTNPAGISEHTNIIQSCDEKIQIIANSDEKLKTIQTMLSGNSSENNNSPE